MSIDIKVIFGVLAVLVPLYIFSVSNSMALNKNIGELSVSISVLSEKVEHIERVVYE